MVIDIEKVMAELTLEEKASLCSGMGYWDTKPVERFGMRPIKMTDGPNGVRLQEGDADRFGLNDSAKATCFPTGSCLACSWDEALFERVGAAIGREARAKQIDSVLGPAVNMKRSPLCGRNFEYLSEDPLLAGKLGAAYVRGMQGEGVSATPKHFAVNNQERLRQTIDARVDERTLREIYLRNFEIIIRESAPWMLMSSYNQINGHFASQNRWLLHDLLRDEWHYEGLTVTDWYGNNERIKGVAAGQDLEMPGNGGITDAEIVQGVKDGVLPMAALDECVRHYLGLYNKLQQVKEPTPPDFGENHSIAHDAAVAGSVLLKNEDGILPLQKRGRIAVIGDFAKHPRYQGGGSSHLNANQMDCAWDCLLATLGEEHLCYAAGYGQDEEEPDAMLIAQAASLAQKADVAVVFCGLTESLESEGFDRETLAMPQSHNELIEAVAAANPNTVVVLQNGSPIQLPWLSKVKAVLESYLGGEAGGSAAADLLLGLENPCGKLAETFPLRLEDTPCYLNFPGSRDSVEYREGIFIGYRYYASAKVETAFPFGYGLSYTTFELSDVRLSTNRWQKGDEAVKVLCTVRNTGACDGAEVVQVYVTAPNVEAVHPAIELKGFQKVALAAGQAKTVEIPLYDLSYWHMDSRAWQVEGGDWLVRVGTSSAELPYALPLHVQGTLKRKVYDQNTLLGELLDHPIVGHWANDVREAFTKAFTGGEAKPHTKLLLERSTVEQPMRVLLCTGFVDKEKLKTLLMLLNGEDTSTRETDWLIY